MRDDHRAMRALWRDLASAAETAGEAGLSLDDIAYAVHEFALGTMALDFSKDQLIAFLAARLREVAVDQIAVVSAGFGKGGSDGLSDVAWTSGLSRAHPRFRQSLFAELDGLRRFCQSP